VKIINEARHLFLYSSDFTISWRTFMPWFQWISKRKSGFI